MPDPTMPQPVPTPAPAPVVRAPVTISIVGSIGPGAFLPNPTSGVVGDRVVFTNSDLVMHRIVLDDGTVMPNLVPGASSAPVALTKTTTGFSCAIHPSMTGSIQDPAVPTPPPTTPPPYERPDPPDYAPPGDGYY